MASTILRSRVRETITGYTGTGNYTCAGATSPDLAISSVMSANDVGDFYIGSTTQWMVARCKVVSTSPAVLQWIYTIENHLNDTTQINFTGGATMDVWLDGPGTRQGKALIKRKSKSGSYTVAGSDLGDLIDCSGTFTLSFTAAATLGDQFSFYMQNSGTGDVTVDPNGSETIDGVTSFIMYPGEKRLVTCDGSAFYSIVLTPYMKTFTASGTFTKPPGYQRHSGQLWGGGASGAKGSSGRQATGGGGAACVPFNYPASLIGATETVTIAAAVAGPSTANTNGTAGNSSTFGSLLTAYGGGLGTQTATTGSPYTGGTGGGADGAGVAGGSSANTKGGDPAKIVSGVAFHNYLGGASSAGETVPYGGGSGGQINGSDQALAAGSAIKGGAGGGSIGSAGGTTTGGTSQEGGAGGAGSSASSGGNGTQPGGGGGATLTGTKAGDGAAGQLTIWGLI